MATAETKGFKCTITGYDIKLPSDVNTSKEPCAASSGGMTSYTCRAFVAAEPSFNEALDKIRLLAFETGFGIVANIYVTPYTQYNDIGIPSTYWFAYGTGIKSTK